MTTSDDIALVQVGDDSGFDHLLKEITDETGTTRDIVGRVLTRVLVASPAGVPRVDVAAGTMLTTPKPLAQSAVSRVTAQLVRQQLLIESERLVARPGPPLRLLRWSPARFYLVGVHIGHRAGRVASLHLAAHALDGELLVAMPRPLKRAARLADVPDVLAGALQELRADPRLADLQPLGVGVEIGAHVDRGVVVIYDNASEGRTSLADGLRARLGALPVVVENDVNARAVSETYGQSLDMDAPRYRPERWRGDPTEGAEQHRERDFAVVAVFHEGVGAAIASDRRVIHGAGGLAGEIGHLAVESCDTDGAASHDDAAGPASPLCSCGGYGHLEALATSKCVGSVLGRPTATAAAEAAYEDGVLTPAALTFARAGRALGRGLAALANLVNPGRILLLITPDLVAQRDDPNTAGHHYMKAVEEELDGAFSTGAADARGRQQRLLVRTLPTEDVPATGAQAAAVCVLDALIQRARGRDGAALTQRPR